MFLKKRIFCAKIWSCKLFYKFQVCLHYASCSSLIVCLFFCLYDLTYQLSPRLCHPCQRILWLIILLFIWFPESREIDKILKRNEKCICFTSSQTNAVDGKDNDGYHQKGEDIYLTSSQTITTTDITPVTRPNMCNNWNEKTSWLYFTTVCQTW